MEYTQGYSMGPDVLGPAPTGLRPPAPNLPGMVPGGWVQTGATQQTGQNVQAVAGVVTPRQQYVQRYAEGYAPGNDPYVAGLRGRARTLPHFGDPLIEPTLGPIREMNGGYPITYLRTAVKSYKPGAEYQSVFVNGRFVPARRFQAQPIKEINANLCR